VPVSYSFDSAIVVIKGAGHYTPDDLKAATLAALDDPVLPENPVGMFDLRDSDVLAKRSSSQLADMALFLERLAPRFNNRLAMVVSSTVGYGLMRLGTAYVETPGIRVEIFREYDDARIWLLASIAGD
jgi:hypothetical protein